MDTFVNSLEKNKVAKYLSIFVVIISVFFAIKVLTAIKEYKYVGKGVYPSSVISVNGKGEVLAKPDVASISYSIVESAKTAKEAQDKATEKSNKTLSVLKSMGIEEKDIKTINYSIYPKYENTITPCTQYYCPPSKSVINGYEINQGFEVKIRKIEKSGDVLAKIGEMNVSNVSGISFVIDDMDKIKAEAKAEAIKDAKEKAKKLSKDLGVKIKKITSYYDNTDNPYGYAEGMGGGVMSAKVDSRMTPEIPVGENKFTATVTITYEIE
jgi:uncharacterized protein YggE